MMDKTTEPYPFRFSKDENRNIKRGKILKISLDQNLKAFSLIQCSWLIVEQAMIYQQEPAL